jgi:ATP-dependent Clp protease ATP-binding subunit ClpA
MFELFTDEARTALVEAQAEAHERSDTALGCEHVLLGLLRQGTGLAARILAEFAVTTDAARAAVDELYGPPPAVPPGEALAAIGIDLERVNARLTETFGAAATAPAPTPYDAEARDALAAALDEAGGRDVGTEHVLAGVLGRSDGRAVKLLEHLGVDVAALATRVRTWA